MIWTSPSPALDAPSRRAARRRPAGARPERPDQTRGPRVRAPRLVIELRVGSAVVPKDVAPGPATANANYKPAASDIPAQENVP